MTKYQDSNLLSSTKRPFGKIKDMTVPMYSFGGGAISGEGGGYGFGDINEGKAIELVQYAYDKGVTLFDSAPIYGFGLSEKRIGKALNHIREKVIYLSKSGVTWHPNKRVNMTNDPQVAEDMVYQSLKDFGTDYIDLYLIHWPDQNVDIRKPLERLAKLQLEKKIKYIGLCNTNATDLALASEVCSIDVIQAEFNLFKRENFEKIYDPFCKKNNAAFMSWGPIDKGILSGKYNLNRKFDDSDCRKSAPWFKQADVVKKVEIVEAAKKLLPSGIDFMELVFSYYFNQNINTILIGAKSMDQFDDALAKLKVGKDLWTSFEKKEDFLKLFV